MSTTRPLPPPVNSLSVRPQAAVPPRSRAMPAPPAPTAPAAPPVPQVQTGRYPAPDFEPVAFQTPEPLSADPGVQALNQDLQDLQSLVRLESRQDPSLLPAIPPDKRERLNQLARQLGFRDFRMLQYQFRNLPPERVQALVQAVQTRLAALPTGSDNRVEPVILARNLAEVFEQQLRGEIQGLMNRAGFPAPQFCESGGRWDSASLAAVFNALSEFQQNSPQMLATIARSPGRDAQGQLLPLTLNRSGVPAVRVQDQFLNSLNEAMYLAHADQQAGAITLSETAVQSNHQDVVRHITGKLDLLTRNLLQDGTPAPVYTLAELQQRGLDTDNAQALQALLLDSWVSRFGGVQNLQRAVNFITRYRALDRPENVAQGRSPFPIIPENGNIRDPQLRQVLARMGPSLLREVAARMEQTDAIAQLQTFMRENSPLGQQRGLAADGIYGTQTLASVRQFQMTLALNTFKERIEDDTRLSEPQKIEMLRFFESKFQRLERQPDQFQQILRTINTRMRGLFQEPAQVSSDTATLLRQDLQVMGQLADGIFDTQTATYLVSSWFNVMDSGSGLDVAEQLVSHELGHLFERQLDQESALQVLDNWGCFFDGGDERAEFGVFHMSRQDFQDRLQSDHSAASDYGAVSPSEDFAESSRIFTYDPQRLLRRSLLKFLVMNSLQGYPHRAEDILRMAEASGYSHEQIQQALQAVLGYGEHPVRFTPALAARLDRDYAPLRQLLSASSHHAAASAPPTHTDHPEISARNHGAIHAALAVPSSEAGWSLDFLQARYTRLSVQEQEAFLRQGLAGLGDSLIPADAQVALEQALESLGYSGEQAVQGRAVILALARIRAQGALNLEQDPLLSNYLPVGFKTMVQNPEYLRSLTYGQQEGRSVSPTSVLTHALTQSAQLDTEIRRLMRDASRFMDRALAALSDSSAPAAMAQAPLGAARVDSSQDPIQRLLANTLFQRSFELLKQLVATISQATGQSLNPPSPEAFARYALSQRASGQDFQGMLERYLVTLRAK